MFLFTWINAVKQINVVFYSSVCEVIPIETVQIKTGGTVIKLREEFIKLVGVKSVKGTQDKTVWVETQGEVEEVWRVQNIFGAS